MTLLMSPHALPGRRRVVGTYFAAPDPAAEASLERRSMSAPACLYVARSAASSLRTFCAVERRARMKFTESVVGCPCLSRRTVSGERL